MFGIDDAVVGAIGGSLVSNIFADNRQNSAQEFAAGQQTNAQTFNAQQAAQQREWAQNMWQMQNADAWAQRGTQYQTAVGDLKAAGLNPMLAYMQGGARPVESGAPGGAAASSSPATAGIASPGAGPDIPAAMQTASRIKIADAEADRIKAEADEIRARTPTYAANIERTNQQVTESKAQVEKLIQETATSAYSAANIQQQTLNLQAALPQIEATVQNLRALTTLHGAQAAEAVSKMNVNYAQFNDIQQRVKQNLPELERVLGELSARSQRLGITAQEASQPGQAAAAAANDSFIGIMGAYLRAINPIADVLNAGPNVTHIHRK